MSSHERTEIPPGLSAGDARRLMRTSPPASTPRARPNRKALRGVIFATIGLLCVATLPTSPRLAMLLTDAAVAPAPPPKGLAGALALNPHLAVIVTAVALTGLLFGALAIVDGIFGWLEVRAHGGRRPPAILAATLGALAVAVFFWSFYFPESLPF